MGVCTESWGDCKHICMSRQTAVIPGESCFQPFQVHSKIKLQVSLLQNASFETRGTLVKDNMG